jgi:hypothetical protein
MEEDMGVLGVRGPMFGGGVTEHGVTGQHCRSDPDLDFVCTSTWLAAHYFSSLRQCMAAALV